MPLKGVQNWVNGWVNVNSNHVSFQEDDSGRFRAHGDSAVRQRVSFEQNEADKGKNVRTLASGPPKSLPVIGDGRAILDPRRGESDGSMYGLQGGPATGQDERNESFNKVSSKKSLKRGKLKRTNSHSDLLKEKAASKRDLQSHSIPELSQYHNSPDRRNSTSTAPTVGRDNKQQQYIEARRKTPLKSNASHSLQSTTGQFINEKAFDMQRSSQLKAMAEDSTKRPLNKSMSKLQTKVALPGSTASSKSSKTPTSMNINDRSIQSPSPPVPALSGIYEQQGYDYLQTKLLRAKLKNENEQDNPQMSEEQLKDHCGRCKEAEDRIQALECDLEYLRSVALQSEYVCLECDNNNNNNNATTKINSSSSVASGKASVKSNKSGKISVASGKHSIASGKHSITSGLYSSATSKRKDKRGRFESINHKIPESISLADSSQRLIDITSRYKRQIENITRETARWQNDMHLKLSKLSMLCNDLNEESVKRKEQADTALGELDNVRNERDSKSSELEILRVRVQLYEKQEVENAEIRRLLRENENETLEVTDNAIQERDDIISDLTVRLNQAFKMLETERQRRQVIFPNTRKPEDGNTNS